jgi:hypothetical protein
MAAAAGLQREAERRASQTATTYSFRGCSYSRHVVLVTLRKLMNGRRRSGRGGGAVGGAVGGVGDLAGGGALAGVAVVESGGKSTAAGARPVQL